MSIPAWSQYTYYVVGNYVSYNAETFEAQINNQGVPPLPTNNAWLLISPGGGGVTSITGGTNISATGTSNVTIDFDPAGGVDMLDNPFTNSQYINTNGDIQIYKASPPTYRQVNTANGNGFEIVTNVETAMGASGSLVMKGNNNLAYEARLELANQTAALLTSNIPTIKLNTTSTTLPGGTISYDTSQRLKFSATDGLPTSLIGAEMTMDGALGRMFLDTYADDGTAVRHMRANLDALSKLIAISGNGGSGETGLTIDANSGTESVSLSVSGNETMRANPAGNVAVGGAAYDGSLFINTTGGGYGGITVNNGTNEMNIFSAGGNVVVNQGLRPDGGIVDTANTTGSVGQILTKDGTNALLWTNAAPGAWTGAALSDLDMNQFKIVNVPTISMTDTITDNPTIQLNTSAGTPALITGYNAGSGGYTSVQMTNVPQFQVWTGAVEGVQMGVNTSVGYENFFRGMGLPLRIAQDTGKEATDFMIFDTGSGTGGIAINTTEYFDIQSGNSARINSGVNIELTATAGNIYINAPDGASYTNPEHTAVRTVEYERIPSMLCAVPFFYADKIGGGYTIDTTNPPLSPMVTTPAFTWAYSGKLVGLTNLSRFTTAGFVEVVMSGVLSDVNSDLAWSVELHDLTAGNRYITDLGTWGFNQTTPATDTSYTTFSRKGVLGTYVSVPTLRTVFDVSALAPQIPDGNQVAINIYVISTSGSHPIGEFRWNVSVRPVNPFATW